MDDEQHSGPALAVRGQPPDHRTDHLIALNVIHASLRLAIILAAALLIGNRLGWRLVSLTFDRERLAMGTKD